MASNLRVDSIVPTTSGNVSIGTATGGVTIPGNLGIAGVLTYEDVTNIDSVGVITARSGINVTSGSIGINTTGGNEKLNAFGAIRSSGSSANFNAGLEGTLLDYDIANRVSRVGHVNGASGSARSLAFLTGGGERLRVGPAGQLGIGGANYGTSGQVLTSQGSGSAVQWATPSGGIEVAAQFRLSSGYTIPENSRVTVVNNWEAVDTYGYGGLGSFAAPSSGVFTFPSTGIYHIQWSTYFLAGTGTSYENFITTTTDNNTYNIVARARAEAHDGGDYDNCHCFFLFDVTNVSTHKVKLDVYSRWASTQVRGSSDDNQTYVTFMRLGDT